jgi:hypothetical protein
MTATRSRPGHGIAFSSNYEFIAEPGRPSASCLSGSEPDSDPGLAGIPFAFEGVQAQTDGRRLHGEQRVQLGEAFGVVEELRVRLRPLPAPGSGLTPHERIRDTSRPVVERRRPSVAVGAATTDKTEAGQTFGAVAQRSSRDVVEEAFELGLRQHALLTEQREQTPVCIGDGRERVVPARPAHAAAATTRVDVYEDGTSIYSRARTRHAQTASSPAIRHVWACQSAADRLATARAAVTPPSTSSRRRPCVAPRPRTERPAARPLQLPEQR